MKSGFLSQYFEAVAAKRLSAVEINISKSHQHEFNGSRELKRVLRTSEKSQFVTKFMWIEEQNEALCEDGSVTWYDARENHPTRSEYRLYFPSNAVIEMAKEGDTLFIAKRTDGTLLIILAASGSTIESQLYWLFGLKTPTDTGFNLAEIDQKDHEIDFATRFILDELGIEVEEPENDLLDSLLKPFMDKFPTTSEFSIFARQTLRTPVNLIDDPDSALLSYMEWEEKLFRRHERYIVDLRLREGFAKNEIQDVDGFISYSLSVQNRRKSRAGYAFEDHFTSILIGNDIRFERKAQTENKAKPDFLFPSIQAYKNPGFPNNQLTILGAKTSCKDRWRQILSEAERIPEKHLLTLEPGISENQINEMKAHKVQLVLPSDLHRTYTSNQRSWLLNVKDFINVVKERQREAAILDKLF
jgi:hypothetical protein